MYRETTEVCAGILRLGIDYVYVTKRLGTQNNISLSLNKNIEAARELISTHNEECMAQVLSLLCAYYLPPCGNATHPQPPPSICKEECGYVQESCRATWQAAALAFGSMKPVLSCDDTSKLLYPLPHCCTGAGILLPKPSR